MYYACIYTDFSKEGLPGGGIPKYNHWKNNIINSGFRDESITWNGLDEFGDKLAKGVYVYKIFVKSVDSGENVEKFEKLVILN